MPVRTVFLLLVCFFMLGPGAATALEPFEITDLSITDAQGLPLTEAQPSQEVRIKAAYSLDRPGFVLLNGEVTGPNWIVKLGYRVFFRLSGLYSVVWNIKIPFNANGVCQVQVVEYIPLVNERVQQTAYLTVVPFDAAYVGSDVCSGCHAPMYAAWQQTLHYPYTGCESCHGPGGDHISAPSPATIIVDTSSSVCKPCHSRNDGRVIEAEDGFIKSQQQYNEWAGTKHAKFLQCAGCHNPHYSLQSAPINAIKLACSTCHLFKKRYLGMQFVACTSCHMAPAVKSIDSTGIGPYRKGDTSSHIWRIKTEAEPYHMFALDGSFAVQDGGGPFLTLNFACLSCHNGLQARFYDFISVQKTSTLVH
ncbi:MAG: hypothetical protein JW832_08160 [Deltaproteobacteria bacterium]|nr:hypothetical protein [Deltaproteobacteria bacterium]